MFVVWGPERTFLYNDAYLPILGDRHPAAFARPFFSVWPEVEPVISPVIDGALAGRESFFEDLEVTLTRSGAAEPAWFTFSYSPILDEAGGVPGVLCVCVETTASVRARETALKDQQFAAEQAHVLEVLNATGAALAAELDLDRLVQTVTDAGVEITGAQFGAFFYNVHDEAGGSFLLYSLSGAPREAFSKFPHPRATQVFAPTFKGEGVIRSDDITRDPRYGRNAPHSGMPAGHLPVRSYLAVPVVSRTGEVIGGLFFGHAKPGVFSETVETLVLGVAGQAALAIDNARLYQAAQSEIARRRTSEDALRDLNETLEARVEERTRERDRIFRLSSDLFAVAGFDGYLKVVNPAWERLLGYPEAELLVRPFADLIHPEDHAAATGIVSALRATGAPVTFEDRLVRVDGSSVIVAWTAVPEGEVFYAVGRDVTEERARDEQLRQSQKMEAVGQLTGGIAHDFNNLLTGILGSLELMQTRLRQGRTAEVERFASAATTAANRASSLTHRLLAFSRRQPLDPKPVNANRLATSTEDLLRRTIGESVALEIVAAGGLWLTKCDANQLESAILNLAINARDAMPEGGTITIETANAHLDTAYAARQTDVRPGQYVCISVSDTGSGMTAEVASRAFDPFFTTKPIGQGTGLGLSMVYGFARQSDGYVKIYSEVGQGTTVKIYLPRYRGEEDDTDLNAPARLDEHRGREGEVVLVVEDEQSVRDLVVEVLNDLGYNALEAYDGPSGLRILEAPGRIDLLVTDVGLPGMNGRQLADAARTRRPGLKVLFMTGYAENAAMNGGFLDEGMALITKPFPLQTIASRIRHMIENP